MRACMLDHAMCGAAPSQDISVNESKLRFQKAIHLLTLHCIVEVLASAHDSIIQSTGFVRQILDFRLLRHVLEQPREIAVDEPAGVVPLLHVVAMRLIWREGDVHPLGKPPIVGDKIHSIASVWPVTQCKQLYSEMWSPPLPVQLSSASAFTKVHILER